MCDYSDIVAILLTVAQWLIKAESASATNISTASYQHCIIVKPVIARRQAKPQKHIAALSSMLKEDCARSQLRSATGSNHLSQPVSTSHV